MQLSAVEVYPGLVDLIPTERFLRVDKAIRSLFEKTLMKMEDGLPFIITGDIPAMWLRDSTWQVKPLLKSSHNAVIELLVNLSKTQVKLFLIDPYANAFNIKPNGNCWHKDFSDQSPWVFERKYELDSWASILYLARKIYENYGITTHFDENYREALNQILNLAAIEQNHDLDAYVFLRKNGVPHDSLSNGGKGEPTKYTGMIYSAFRPSDDACKYGYLVPSNLFFCNELKKLPKILQNESSNEIAKNIEDGIKQFALDDGTYSYEVDGYGNRLFIDDANVPSLLSLPYLEVCEYDDVLYKKTRSRVLSAENPYYFSGKILSGVGSPHTPTNHVWPIAIAIEALTSGNTEIQLKALQTLESSDAGTWNMHESVHIDDPNIFTREWFSWSDMTYVDLVLESVSYNSKRNN